MTKLELGLFKAIGLKDLPSPRVLRWTRWIVLVLMALLVVTSCRGAYDSGVAAGFSGLRLFGWTIGVLVMGAVSIWLNAVLLLFIFYGPILAICRAVSAVYHGFVPSCVATWRAVEAACASLASMCTRARQAVAQALADLRSGIKGMTAKDWLAAAKACFSLFVLGAVARLLWPWSSHLIAMLPAWLNLDVFQAFMFALVIDVIACAFCMLIAVTVFRVITSLLFGGADNTRK